jgi:hypothetical protein
VGLARGVGGALEGGGSAGDHRRIEPDAPGHLARVARDARHVRVPVHRGDGDYGERVEACGERDRHGIVDAGIGVDQNGAGHR